jgi:DNA-binding protein HU-beta
MNKKELVNHVVENVDGLSKALANKVVNAVFEAIKHGLKNDGRVPVSRHGSYVVVERAEREGRDPQSGAVTRIPAKKVVKFKVGKDLKDEVNK